MGPVLGQEGRGLVSDGGRQVRGRVTGPAVVIRDTSSHTHRGPPASPLTTCHLLAQAALFRPGVRGGSGQQKEPQPCPLALALTCSVTLGKSLPLSECLFSPL